MKKILYIIASVLFIGSCSSEEDEFQLSNFEIPIITGIQIRNFEGVPMGNIGTPNFKLGSESNDCESEYFISIYPNPANSIFSIALKAPPTAYKKVWIVKALYQENGVPVPENLGMNTLYVGSTPVFRREIMPDSEELVGTNGISERNSNRLQLDVGFFEAGYYRVYFESDGILLYDNILIN